MLRSGEMDYPALAQSYYVRCREGFPGLRGLVLRGSREDMIPGVSDIDMRLICQEGNPSVWLALDEVVQKVHLGFVTRGLPYRRALEHPPGACVTVEEALDAALFHPEMRHWDWCAGDETVRQSLTRHLESLPWGERDERHHLSVFVGALQPKVPPVRTQGLQVPERHRGVASVALHAFLPALQAALSLMERRAVAGRLEAVRRWLQLRPSDPLLTQMLEAAERGFDLSPDEDEAAAADLRRRCRQFLQEIAPQVMVAAQFAGSQLEEAQSARWPVDPLRALHDAVRYFRIRRSHYRCFLGLVPDAELDYLILNEIHTLRSLLTLPALRAYAALKWGQPEAIPEEVLDRMDSQLASSAEKDAVRQLCQLSDGAPGPNEARARLHQAAELYPAYLAVLERMLADVRRR